MNEKHSTRSTQQYCNISEGEVGGSDGVKNSFKEKLLILKILHSRRSAACRILSSLKEYKRVMESKRHELVKHILNKRIWAADFINNHFKGFNVRKKAKPVITRLKDNFCIISQIKYVKKIYLKVFPAGKAGKASPQQFDFEYCHIRQQFVLYIPKDILQNRSIKVNFIADNKVFIDPYFRTDYDQDGHFYNIIEYEKFMKLESDKVEYIDNIMASLVNRQYHRFRYSEDEEIVNKMSTGSICLSSTKHCARNSISFSYNTAMAFRHPTHTSAVVLPRIKTFGNLISPKSILRGPASTNSLNKAKKVSFTNIVTYDY
jgi:hypothetical protein